MSIIKKERVYYHWNIYKNTFFFYFVEEFSVQMDVVVNWLKNNNIHTQAWTARGHCENCFVVTVDINFSPVVEFFLILTLLFLW